MKRHKKIETDAPPIGDHLLDKDAALVAGYSLSVAENTKQRIWKPRVRAEFERLLEIRASRQ